MSDKSCARLFTDWPRHFETHRRHWCHSQTPESQENTYLPYLSQPHTAANAHPPPKNPTRL